eukprot:4988646-Amphidinium_carterae.1
MATLFHRYVISKRIRVKELSDTMVALESPLQSIDRVKEFLVDPTWENALAHSDPDYVWLFTT